ncbi:uncharacterized protein TRAVEDRAFT_75090 [Trametes versicolor FP-101664 SS1]|uniref:uncharacterized protein n=1 Tax=Trametes versicolor (strain FP-101664) TaxID=717944 RepID=UPI0004623104|nr:uncharacterized protein TRAVEDRAFT_75090 [Trametes versicolor FP-101664 SS1]EIW52801.1 hypothetical protein TRAVEDRAFT_75090 [Trametes versicolor FP-101664 SS1]
MNSSSVLRADLTGLLLEGILFGCFTILYPISLWMLVYKHRRRGYTRLGMFLFAIVTTMFLLALTHLTLLADDVIEDFANHSAVANGPLIFLVSGSGHSTTVASIVIHAVVSWIGDIFMTIGESAFGRHEEHPIRDPRKTFVHALQGRPGRARTPSVDGRSPRRGARYSVQDVTPPPLPSRACGDGFATVVTGLCVYAFKNSHLDGGEALYADNVYALMTTYLALVLAMNITTLALILGQLMRHDRMIREYRVDAPGPTMPWRVARTIVQSEAVYSATILANLILYVTRSSGFFVTSFMLPPLVGISFTLIITHSGLDEIMGQLKMANDAAHDLEWVVNKSLKDSLATTSLQSSWTAVTVSTSSQTSLHGT